MQIKRFLGNIAKTYLALGAISVSAFANADMYPYQQNNSDWGCAPQCCDTAPACNWGYNPPAYLRCGGCCGSDGFLDALSGRVDFLWWRASEDCLTLGYEEEVAFSRGVPVSPTDFINRSHEKKPNFKFDPGFRLGLRHYCPCDCWDIAFNWTHYHTKANTTGRGDTDFPTTPFTGEINLFTNCWERLQSQFPSFAHSRWNLDLDLLDLELGYKYFVSSCFAVRPHFGLRGARIDQTYRVFSFANDDNPFADIPDSPFNDFNSESKSRNDFLAVGPRLGVEAEVHFGCGFSIFGEAAGSIVFGRFNRHAEEEYRYFGFEDDIGSSADELTFEYYSHDTNRNSRAITDLNVGIKWDHCFCWCNRMHPVSLAFSWEHHAFFNQNNFNFKPGAIVSDDFTDLSSECCCKQGDLFTQGLTVSLEVGF